MGSWLLIALILGLVEGMTEFLPVSSTGHLILAGSLLRFDGELAASFQIFIQLGAILAVVVLYRRRFARLFAVRDVSGFSGFRGLVMLGLTMLPAVMLGLIFHKHIKMYLFNPFNVAAGLLAGGIWIVLAERFRSPPKVDSLDRLTWRHALAIGVFQCLALWPGMSRSASTILGGMIVGLDRKTAAEYSFIAAVPLMAAACLFDIVKSADLVQSGDLLPFALGFGMAFVSALLSVEFLVRFVSRHTFIPFGWYRIGIAILVFVLLR